MAKRFDIRNSTAEFLIFMAEGKEDGVQVMYADETIWCTQDAIATLFDKGRSTIAEHLSNIFKEGELTREAVISDKLLQMANRTTHTSTTLMPSSASAIEPIHGEPHNSANGAPLCFVSMLSEAM